MGSRVGYKGESERAERVLDPQIRLTETLVRAGDCPPLESEIASLRRRPRLGIPQEGGRNISTEGRPCIYDTLDFAVFARAWVAWMRKRGRSCSARALAKRMGVSPTLVLKLIKGTTVLRADHMAAVVPGFGLSPPEAIYAEGLARYAAAEDPEERARERQSLVTYAAAQGVRTAEGEAWRVSSHWGAPAIWALSFLPLFRANPAWISLALRGRLPVKDARELLAALVETKLLVADDQKALYPAGEYRWEQTHDSVLNAFALQDSVLRLIQNDLDLPAPDQHFHGCVLALSDEAQAMVWAALDAYWAEISRLILASQERVRLGLSQPDRVLCSAYPLFPVSHRLALSLKPEVRRR